MPEAPELSGAVSFLARRCQGVLISDIQVSALSAVKTAEPPLQSLVGQPITEVRRRGKYLILQAAEAAIVVHLSRAGWLVWRPAVPAARLRPGRGRVSARISFVDHDGVVVGCLDLTEAGTQKRLAIWVAEDAELLDPVARLGPEATGLTADQLGSILEAGGASHLKTVLRNQSSLAGIGNAYSDEILYRARLSPARRANSLNDDETDRLYDALAACLAEAVALAEEADDLSALKDTKRRHFRMHGRAGEECSVCGTIIASVSSGDSSYQYCPGCQTDGKRLPDHRLSRLLR